MKLRLLSTFVALLVRQSLAELDVPAHREDGFQTVPLRTHSLFQPYTESHLQNRWWDFGGDTLIRQGEYIRLTSERPAQHGWLFSRLPLTATNWEVEVTFKISGQGHLFGDGMAMWITKERGQVGPVFGHTDKFNGIGIFIDTYKNSRPGVTFPYVMAMHGDGSKSYDSGSDGREQEFAGCSARGLRASEGNAKMKVVYLADQEFRVDLMYPNEENWRTCFTTAPPTLPPAAYLGFSAETGELSDNHDIIFINTLNLYAPATGGPGHGHSGAASKSAGQSNARGTHAYDVDGNRGSWLWTFTKIVFFFAVIAAGYIGFTAYRAQQKRSRF